MLVEAGADLVVGHHPHVPHSIEFVNGRPVFYSLGNGPLGTPGRFHSGRPPYGLIATVGVDASHRIERVEARLIAVDNAQVRFSPKPVGAGASQGFLESLVSTGERWKTGADGALFIELLRSRKVRPVSK
jgi:hypothetical protein